MGYMARLLQFSSFQDISSDERVAGVAISVGGKSFPIFQCKRKIYKPISKKTSNFFEKRTEKKQKLFVHTLSSRSYVQDEQIVIMGEKIFQFDFQEENPNVKLISEKSPKLTEKTKSETKQFVKPKPSIELLGQFFFLCLLVVVFAGQPCLCLAAGLVIGLAISEAESIGCCPFLLISFGIDLLKTSGFHDFLTFCKQSKALFTFLANHVSILGHNWL